jgi:hypothetical protein
VQEEKNINCNIIKKRVEHKSGQEAVDISKVSSAS